MLGESLTQKFVYFGTSDTGQIYALNENDGQPLWQTSAQGTFASGFSLRQGYLLLTTRDGNDGTNVGLRAVKVDATRLTSSAPWPRFGGNDGNSGISPLSDQAP